MAATNRKGTGGHLLSDEDLRREALARVRESFVAKPSELTAALGLAKTQAPRVLDVLREAARTGALARWQKRKVELFFAEPPATVLDRDVVKLLASGPKTIAELAELTLIPAAFVDEWKKSALASGRLFELALPNPRGKMKLKKLSLEPDLGAVLAKKLTRTLRVAVAGLRDRGVEDDRIAQVILSELGLREDALVPAKRRGDDTELVLGELERFARDQRAGALLRVAELRTRLPLDKRRFDGAALALRDRGSVILQLHDHPAHLPDEQRAALVQDARGNHYVGIALSPD